MEKDYKYAHLRGDPDDPLKKFDKKAREWTKIYAK